MFSIIVSSEEIYNKNILVIEDKLLLGLKLIIF